DIFLIFKIDIVYDTSQRVYKIDDNDIPELNNRMLEAIETFNALNLSDRFSNYIHFEKRKANGTHYIYDILKAIENRKLINIQYFKFWNEGIYPIVRTIAPLGLK